MANNQFLMDLSIFINLMQPIFGRPNHMYPYFIVRTGAYVLLLFETVETVVFAISPRFKPWAMMANNQFQWIYPFSLI